MGECSLWVNIPYALKTRLKMKKIAMSLTHKKLLKTQFLLKGLIGYLLFNRFEFQKKHADTFLFTFKSLVLVTRKKSFLNKKLAVADVPSCSELPI